MTNQGKAYAFGGLTVLLWSTVATAFKLSLTYMNPAQLLLYASFSSFAALLFILIAQGRFRQIFTCSARQYFFSALMGFLNPFLYYNILFKAYDLLPAQEAQPLNYTWAIALALLSIPLLGQRIGKRDLAAAFFGYLGVVVIATHGDLFSLKFSNTLGVVLALTSTIVWALYWIANTGDSRDPVVGLFLNFAFSLPMVSGWCLIVSSPVVPLAGLAGAIYVGLFEMGITFVLWLYALRLSENTAKVGNLIFLSPFVSLILIHYIVGEEILPSTFVGLILIVAGLLVQRKAR